jgi:hypothetical protein
MPRSGPLITTGALDPPRPETLPDWEGYRGRALLDRDGAADQLQLDVYGEAIDSIYRADLSMVTLSPVRASWKKDAAVRKITWGPVLRRNCRHREAERQRP